MFLFKTFMYVVSFNLETDEISDYENDSASNNTPKDSPKKTPQKRTMDDYVGTSPAKKSKEVVIIMKLIYFSR